MKNQCDGCLRGLPLNAVGHHVDTSVDVFAGNRITGCDKHLYEGRRRILIMRGLPGSGKSTLARCLPRSVMDGVDVPVVLSADDYFMADNGTGDGIYLFEAKCVPLAHAWNLRRLEKLMEKRIGFIVIDNTHMQLWEMRDTVQRAVENDYEIDWREPHTEWAWNVEECAKRNKHGVPLDAIVRMRDRFEKLPSDTVATILKARAPWEK